MRVEEVVGYRIKDIRELNGITQDELGRSLETLLGRAWSRQAVSTAEKGGRAFTAAELVAVAYALGTTVSRLLTPPTHVRTVALPGAEIQRSEMTSRAIPKYAAERSFDAMLESIRTIAQNIKGAEQFNQLSMQAIEHLYGQLETAVTALAVREQMERGSDSGGRQQSEEE